MYLKLFKAFIVSSLPQPFGLYFYSGFFPSDFEDRKMSVRNIRKERMEINCARIVLPVRDQKCCLQKSQELEGWKSNWRRQNHMVNLTNKESMTFIFKALNLIFLILDLRDNAKH
ncbi:hypothetical protein KIL84_011458 [Mauremys mutica]|uniref:Uncharacterized protein n=1 Tax=Mauremys mutica TaxID=74926 RepID=A0A9D3XDN9_9SAUR|nr:hypothetical protein KIL84_011458 [Mauremys mutica]